MYVILYSIASFSHITISYHIKNFVKAVKILEDVIKYQIQTMDLNNIKLKSANHSITFNQCLCLILNNTNIIKEVLFARSINGQLCRSLYMCTATQLRQVIDKYYSICRFYQDNVIMI